MKFIYLTIASILIIALTLNSQNMSPFLQANNSGWYPEFLKPVITEINNQGKDLNVLDVGTGPGKLPELLIKSDSSLHITGIDINTSYIDLANQRFHHKNVLFKYEEENKPLEFDNETFDIITFCSVLFLVDENTKSLLMNEALRVLKPGGKIIVLTPSGQKSSLSSFQEIGNFPYFNYNWTYFVWKTLTKTGGKRWQTENWLQNYSKRKQLSFSKKLVFNNNATIETIIKPNNN